MDHGIDAAGTEFDGESGDGFATGDVTRFGAPGFNESEACSRLGRVREADHFMPGGMKEICGTLADESTSCDEHLHSGRFF